MINRLPAINENGISVIFLENRNVKLDINPTCHDSIKIIYISDIIERIDKTARITAKILGHYATLLIQYEFRGLKISAVYLLSDNIKSIVNSITSDIKDILSFEYALNKISKLVPQDNYIITYNSLTIADVGASNKAIMYIDSKNINNLMDFDNSLIEYNEVQRIIYSLENSPNLEKFHGENIEYFGIACKINKRKIEFYLPYIMRSLVKDKNTETKMAIKWFLINNKYEQLLTFLKSIIIRLL